MKFKSIKKRKTYETWKHTNKRTRLVSYIFRLSDTVYHFTITCNMNLCKFKSCPDRIKYSSLQQKETYQSFDECLKAVETWHMNQ